MRSLIVAAMFLAAAGAQAQTAASRVTSAADRALLTKLVEREDSRQLPTASDAREQGLTAQNAYLRAFTVRGLGRLEKPELLARIEKMLGDASPEVRASAADAIAQAVFRGGDSVARARTILVGHLARERDLAARAMTLEAIGRLAQGSVEQVKATANVIAPSLAATSVVERRGAVRGMFFLTQKREARAAGVIPAGVTDRMFAMLDEESAGFTPTDRYTIAYALWSAVALSDQRSHRLFADHETMVRERGVANFARSTDLPLIRAHLEKTLVDSAPIIRFRSIGLYAQKLRATDGCGPLVSLTRDRDATVALGATDALSGCRNDTTVARHLRMMAAELRDDDRWHLPAHAFVALSVVDPAGARELMPVFMGAKNFYVRMYADTAARALRDTASLYILSRDTHANVQSAAIEGLSRIVGHAADSIYVRALASDDNQVLMAASAALEGSSYPRLAEIVAARHYERMQRGWETDRDGQDALAALARKVNATIVARGNHIQNPLPTFDDLAAMEKVTARIEMADGGVVTMKLHPFDAPTNAFRFVRLARAGTFDGLTFHRVAPFFVVQGPGPNANEYSAPDKPFARDELGLSNVRGTVGLSTRGRDTGDGQLYVNTVDNIRLDHDYTVMATITSGLELFDRIQEGARIRRITISP